MQNRVTRTGWILGYGAMLASFFVAAGPVNLLALGFFILGATFLLNYYFYKGFKNQIEFWWQNISGFFCILIAVYYQFHFGKLKIGWALTSIFIMVLFAKYIYIRKSVNKGKNQSIRRF